MADPFRPALEVERNRLKAQRDDLLKAIEEHRRLYEGLTDYALHRALYATATHIEGEAGK
jgi:hypothetical protein